MSTHSIYVLSIDIKHLKQVIISPSPGIEILQIFKKWGE